MSGEEEMFLLSLRLRLRSGLRQHGVGVNSPLPRAYPSARKRASERTWANSCRTSGAGLWLRVALRSSRLHFRESTRKIVLCSFAVMRF